MFNGLFRMIRALELDIVFLVSEPWCAGDEEVSDLLRGDSALLDAAKRGQLTRVRRLLTPENINCRDSLGRNSTPLHLAAGYNNLEVAEFLLENGADVNAQDKGGLIPL
jgi:tankyrase